MDLGEDALHLLQVGLAAAVEAHAAVAVIEQRHVGVLLQRPDAVGDGGRGDAEFLGGEGEALVAGRGLEEAPAIERGQEEHAGRPPDRAPCRQRDSGSAALPAGSGPYAFFGSILFSHSENYLI